ncbi:MAG: ComF family protein [Gammaproteobacteria bacterium]|nr:ComF family protein [Gammaproteobacteria bacterium]
MIKGILNAIYPRRCVLCMTSCRQSDDSPLDLCKDCQNDLPLMESACFQCAIPLQNTLEAQRCGQCLQKPPAFDHVISFYHYQQPLIWLIQQMKFHKRILLARLLSQLMVRRLQLHQSLSIPDAIIPVPLHHKRRYQRGFNQAEELAKSIAKALHCPLDSHYLERHLNNPQQSGLNAKQRRKNVKGVFRISHKTTKHYSHVAIIDDVMSTGSTLNEIARVLKKSGIKKVDVWVLARASR